MAQKAEKDEVFWKVLNCAIELEMKHGHQQWSMTELSKKSDITRSLIYYYFGRSRLDILTAAVQIIGSEVFGLTQKKMEDWNAERMVEAIQRNRELYEKSPHLLSFYLVHRNRDSDLGNRIRSYEKQYIAKMTKFFPHRTPDELEALWCYAFGLIAAPSLSGASRVKAHEILKTFLHL